jgi:FAD/FMN-containing dehydrogenase
MYAGPVEAGERALAAIRAFGPPAADSFEPTTYADFQCSIDDPPGYRNYWTAEHVRELPDAAIRALHERSRHIPAGPSQLFIVAWGGAVARTGEDRSPLAGRDARFIVHPLFLWDDAADDEANVAIARAYRDDMRPWATGATYLNFLGDEGEARRRAGFTGGGLERLERVKAEWDPDGVFEVHRAR